jgi:hypothetical protein
MTRSRSCWWWEVASLKRFQLALCLVSAMLVVLVACPALAYDYRVPILIDDEDDVYELLGSGDITDDEKDALLGLLRDPIDLNAASRRDLYALPGLSYAMVDAIIARRDDKPFTRVTQLKKIPGVTSDIFVQVRTFVRVLAVKKSGGKKEKSNIKAKVRAKIADRIRGKGTSATSKEDDDLPEGYVRVKVEDRGSWEVGAVLVTQNTIGSVSNVGSNLEVAPYVVKDEDGLIVPYDIDYDDYYFVKTSGETYMPAWPKVYARFHFGDVDALAGSYRIGFGQRLLIDNIGQQNPYGFKPDLYVGEGEYGFSPYRGLFGAVATIPLVRSGGMELEATPFFSWWRNDIYQSDMKHKVSQADGCIPEIPETCYDKYALLEPYDDASFFKLSSQSFPRAWSELMGGANVTLKLDRNSHVGLTGFGSMIDFHFGDDAAVLTGNGYPERTVFYALGLDGAYVLGDLSFFGEVALMDNLSYAGLGRAVWELGDFVVEGLVRYYDDDYDNPHSRGDAASDEFEGSRRAGELGAQVSLKYRPAKWLTLRLDEDLWRAPVWKDSDLEEARTYPWRSETYLRVDTMPVEKVRLGGYFKLTDRDITVTGTEEDYYSAGSEPPRGEKYQWGVQLSTQWIPNTQLWAYYKQSFTDVGLNDPDSDAPKDARELEHYAVFKVSLRPLGFIEKKWERALIIDARAKYFEGNLEGDEAFSFTGVSGADRYAEGYLQVGTTVWKKYHLGVRGAMREHFEKETSYGSSKKATEWFYKLTLDVEI